MPITYFPIVCQVRWGDLTGTITEQADLKTELDGKAPVSHIEDTDNPHSVTKSQTGLANVSNDAQLKRSSNDFYSFTEKSSYTNDDIVLIEDSGDNYNKKKLKISNLSSGPISPTTALQPWIDLNGSQASTNSFTFSGSSAQAKAIIGSLFTCTDSTGATRRIGYIQAASESSGTITVTVVTDSDLASGDKDFKVTPNRKLWDFLHLISIPGELVADASNSQGTWLLNLKFDSFLLPVDSAVRTAAGGTNSACAWNIYKNTTALFSTAQDMTTNSYYNERRPTTNTISTNDNISLRITNIGGDTNKATDFQAKLYIVPQHLFAAIN